MISLFRQCLSWLLGVLDRQKSNYFLLFFSLHDLCYYFKEVKYRFWCFELTYFVLRAIYRLVKILLICLKMSNQNSLLFSVLLSLGGILGILEKVKEINKF